VRTLTFAVVKDDTLNRTVTFERDGSWTVEPADPPFDFTPATGDFAFTVSTLDLTGPQPFTFTATDLNGNTSDLDITIVEEEGAGPEVQLDPGCPTIYSSSVTTSITVQGHVDLTYLEPGSTRYKVVPAIGLPRSETAFTPDGMGNFEFTFDPQAAPELTGTLTVHVWATDTRDVTTEITHAIYDDPGAPTGTFSIASGAAYATEAGTSLTVAIADAISSVDFMRFRNQSAPSDPDPWLDYAGGSFPWTLSTPDGTRTVHAQFRDTAGNVLDASDTIVLDTAVPTMTDAFLINDGDDYTTAVDCEVHLDFEVDDATSGMKDMKLWDNGQSEPSSWQTYDDASGLSWTLHDTASDGTKTVSARFRDNAGWIRSETDAIILDRYPPQVTAFVINDGAAWTNARDVHVDLTASDDGTGLDEMRLRNAGSTWGSWLPFAATAGLKLPDADGDSLTVYADIRDKIATHVAAANDAIGLDRVNPVIAAFTINNGDASTSSLVVDLQISASDDRSGMSRMRFSNDGLTWSAWEPYAATRSGWTLEFMMGFPGPRTVHVEVHDEAGNTASALDDIFYP